MTELGAGQHGRYRHEALLYSGQDEFLAGTAALIIGAVQAGQPVLAALTADKLDLLRAKLGLAQAGVTLADMAEIGANPARIISVWRHFADEHAGARQLWGIGEPVYPARSPAEITECQLYEGLLNMAVDADTPFWLLCPYDLQALTAEVIAGARRSHPFLTASGKRQASATFRPFDTAEAFGRPLPQRPADAAALPFAVGGLRAVRAFAAEQAKRAGLDGERVPALVAAVNEVATNSLLHGGGHGRVYAWPDGAVLLFEVSDEGHFTAPMAGRMPPVGDSGAGLWLANQLCDLVQICATPEGTSVRLHSRL